MQALEDLIVASATLARTAPQQWREFLTALAGFSEHHRENLVKSPLVDLPVNQGRAQILSVLHDTLDKSPTKADEIARKASRK